MLLSDTQGPAARETFPSPLAELGGILSQQLLREGLFQMLTIWGRPAICHSLSRVAKCIGEWNFRVCFLPSHCRFF